MLELSTLLLLGAIVLMMRGPFDFRPALAGLPAGFELREEPERKAWEDLLMFKKGGGSSAPAPDPQIGAAALKTAETGQQWLDFAREQFAVGNERQAALDKLTGEVTGAQLEAMRDSNTRSDEQWDRYKKVFQPVEDRVVSDAMSWDSEERQAQMAAEAKADVATAAAQAQEQNQRQMASMGVDPRSGRYAGVDRGSDLSTALASAGAQNNARNTVRAQGAAMREGVANMGRGATSTAAQQLSLGLNAGNSASGNALGAEGNWRANGQIMGQGFGGAMQGYGTQANILNQQYGNQLNAWSAEQASKSASASGLMSGIGSLVGSGAALYALSSKEAKEDKQPVEGALDALASMPVEKWRYKQGLGDEGEHIGPYAEDFQAATGSGDGTTIPVMDAIGLTMKAVQELNAKVDGKRKPAKREPVTVEGEYSLVGGIA